jgi:hypothetical protein
MFDSVTDDEIEAAIAQYDDPDHDEAYSVEEIQDVLGRTNEDIIDNWDLHQDAIDEDAHKIVHEDSEVVVLADHTGQFWNEQFNVMDLPDDEHGILHSIVVSLHHDAARGHCDYSWSVSNPAVVEKPSAFQAGEEQVLREVARRTEEFGSVARAVDTLATDVHGWSKSRWASVTDRNPSTVTRTTEN